MALPRQLTDLLIQFRTDSGTTYKYYTVTVQNSAFEIVPEYFSGSSYKESIGGKRISDIRGFRIKINLSYEASQESIDKREVVSGVGTDSSSTFREMFNDIVQAFKDDTINIDGTDETFTGLDIGINSDTSIDGFRKFIVEDMSYTQTYRNQIGRFTPSITLCSEDIVTEIGADFEGVL